MKNTKYKNKGKVWNSKDTNTLLTLYRTGCKYKDMPSKLFRSPKSIQQKVSVMLQNKEIKPWDKSKRNLARKRNLEMIKEFTGSKKKQQKSVKKTSKPTKPMMVNMNTEAIELIQELNRTKPTKVVITIGEVEITAIY